MAPAGLTWLLPCAGPMGNGTCVTMRGSALCRRPRSGKRRPSSCSMHGQTLLQTLLRARMYKSDTKRI